jgi:very-short-patch-repair endonuclease
VATDIVDAMGASDARRDEPLVRIMTAAGLAKAGLSPAAIRTRLKRGDLIRVGVGFYVTAAVAARIRSRAHGDRLLAAAVAVAGRGPGTAASHQTAAIIQDLDLLGRPAAGVTVTRSPGTGSEQGRPGVGLKTAQLPRSQVVTRCGVSVTSVARTVVDVARSSSFRAGVVTADSALRLKLTTKEELGSVLATCRQWPGSARAAQVIAFADRRSESALESVCRVAFRDLGLPPPQLQIRVGNEFDELARVDFLWREFSTIAEADGAIKYADPDRARQQLWRDARLHEAGFQVVHITWNDITRYPDNVAAALRAAFQRGLALRDAAAG